MDTGLGKLVRAAVIVPALTLSFPAIADTWTATPDDGDIEFTGKQLGASFEGEFESFNADIVFSPDDLAGSKVVVVIDIASADSGNPERDTQMLTADWFDVEQWPTARFETKSFREIGPNQYETVADLTIRDVTREVVLPFRLEIDGNDADAEGTVVIKRSDFGVGQGEWSDTSQIGDEVTIRIDLEATRG
ncbi:MULTISPECIES: YceI family protein [Thalassospira]|jgi:polyisoprenoid-binding protein YceI|uniref:YceI family protein n=1 Tax=Thalassospira TaxID=168934 RepID=UPI000C9A5DCF|nr:YceI family protein [Thalassospira sp. GB04J01]|tara:strand:+ start:1502 stop:2074 length:573 start_codon:yes stop_codon:yes gene_type:complete